MTGAGRDSPWILAGSAIVAAVIFLLDMSLPLGGAGGVLYIALVLVGWWFHTLLAIALLAAAATLFALAECVWLAKTGAPWMALADRAPVIFAIWITAAMLAAVKKSQTDHGDLIGALGRKVRAPIDALAATRRSRDAGPADRQQPVAAPQVSQQRFRDVMQMACDWFVETDEEMRITSAFEPGSAAAPRNTERLVGESLWDLMDADSNLSGNRLRLDVLTHQPFRDLEFQHRGSDGGTQYVRWSGVPFFDATGRFKGYRCVGHDVSQSKAQELQHSRIVANIADGLVVIDDQGIIESVNPAIERLFRYKATELVGKNVKILMPEHHALRHDAYIANFLRTREPKILCRCIEVFAKRKDGSDFLAELTVTQFTMGETVKFVGILRDITERKEAEEALRRQALLFEQISDAIIVTDMDARVVDWSPAAAAMFGYSKKEILGQSLEILRRPAEQRTLAATIIGGLKRGGRWAGEINFIRKDGSEGVCETVVVPLQTKKGDTVKTLGVYRDVSARKEMEDVRRSLQEQVLQTQKIEALGTLASGIAHDFNNSLFPIIGLTEFTRSKLPPESQAYNNLSKVLSAAYHARDLVRQILAFSRKEQPHQRPVRLEQVVRESLRFLRAALPSTVRIEERLEGQFPLVLADPTQIHQVLVNLGVNAGDAMATHGGVLSVKLSVIEVGLGLDSRYADVAPGSYVRLEVSDTGCGMNNDMLSRIFEPFFTTKRAGDGTGLGLSVVHRIINNHSGAISVQSEPGRGTTFTVILPAVGTAIDKPAPARPDRDVERPCALS